MGNKSHFFRQSSGGVIGSPFLNFRFEESITDDNTVIDNIGGLNATLIGNKTVRENTGAIQRGYTFDGSTRVKLQPITLQYPFCIKLWSNLNGTNNDVRFSSWTSLYNGIDLAYLNNLFYVQFGSGGTPGGANRKSFNTTSISVGNEWKQFLVVFKADFDFDIYIDGLKYTGSLSSNGGATSVSLNNLEFSAGYASNLFNNNVSIDEITMFNQELTPQEILQIYNKESNGIRVF